MKISINSLTVKLDHLWSIVTGREHQYFVTLGFKPKGHTAPAQYTIHHTFSVRLRTGPTFLRAIRKFYGKKFVDQIPKNYRNNGHITIEKITYLGRF
ncbi:MAG: hypothetical protein ACRC8D_08535 [Aeromonas sp.]